MIEKLDNDNRQQQLLLLESLERALLEVEALEAIYGDGNCFVCNENDVSVIQHAKEIVKLQQQNITIPSIHFKIKVSIDDGDDNNSNVPNSTACSVILFLDCTMPPGYPDNTPLKISIISSSFSKEFHVHRKQQETWSEILTNRTNELIEQEAVVEIVQELTELLLSYQQEQQEQDDADDNDINDNNNASKKSSIGRRWIWVHHITNTNRQKSILEEANRLDLGGYIKAGYPGVVVIEGLESNCDEFVTWIKGNKSRPNGGFGRNWGHHVRGQVHEEEEEEVGDGTATTTEKKSLRKLPQPFTQISNDDMSVLGAKLKALQLEDEFLQYIMQHK